MPSVSDWGSEPGGSTAPENILHTGISRSRGVQNAEMVQDFYHHDENRRVHDVHKILQLFCVVLPHIIFVKENR